jgi:hypothetical protein
MTRSRHSRHSRHRRHSRLEPLSALPTAVQEEHVAPLRAAQQAGYTRAGYTLANECCLDMYLSLQRLARQPSRRTVAGADDPRCVASFSVHRATWVAIYGGDLSSPYLRRRFYSAGAFLRWLGVVCRRDLHALACKKLLPTQELRELQQAASGGPTPRPERWCLVCPVALVQSPCAGLHFGGAAAATVFVLKRGPQWSCVAQVSATAPVGVLVASVATAQLHQQLPIALEHHRRTASGGGNVAKVVAAALCLSLAGFTRVAGTLFQY